MPHSYLFNRHRYLLHLQRAAKQPEDFLLREMAERLCDRLLDVNRQFDNVLVVSPLPALVASYIPTSAKMVRVIHAEEAEAEILSFSPGQFDLVLHCGGLHWINDLLGMLIQIQTILKPDGLLLAMVPGGETLKELRASFEAAEMASRGGISPRISPFVDIRDAGALLQRAGFALPVADSEMLEIVYPHPLKLLHDLRAMGQTNAMAASHKGLTPCALMMQMADHYMQHYARQEGGVSASIELVTMTAWKPHASQQQPARRGSGKENLGEVLG